jgi:hypothetical protein
MLKTCQNHFRHAQTLAYTNVWIVPSPIHSEHPHSTSFYCLVPNMCASPYWNPGFSTWTKGKNISRVILRTSCGLSRTAGRMGYHQPTWCTPNSGGLWSFHIISTYDYINYNYFWVACLDSCIYIYVVYINISQYIYHHFPLIHFVVMALSMYTHSSTAGDVDSAAIASYPFHRYPHHPQVSL